MRVVITGGTGFIGRKLSRALVAKGYQVIALTRSTRVSDISGVRNVVWDGESSSGWEEFIDGATAVVNLAGENIASGRWSTAKKNRILHSRLAAGHAVTEGVTKAKNRPKVVVQASAIGFYGPRGAEPVTEETQSGDSFLAEVSKKWEASTAGIESYGIRRVIVRTSMVLGCGGALSKMIGPFKLGLGSYLGHGHQGVSWIHIDDEVWAIIYLIENKTCSGVYNLSSTHPVTSNKFTDTLGEVLGKRVFLRVPSVLLKLILGQMAEEVLLTGQFVLPERLITAGFNFEHLDLKEALTHFVD
ncbi:TIGR01777 family oxidoreductase [Desulfovibrio sp. UCD-KL4C]|uniref:TIGR01777 family oxidoreductase n=1 Tax=Desulfovibrio sp. UCD-KL4C TaxID=2578120 RepID=UPI0025BB2B9A|nr:TIGR01777 family oxidoreductase [Desulfovibrio sp. UCD-KL4C]